jgi:hypothetical protein
MDGAHMENQFPETFTSRLPPGFVAGLTTLARRQYCTVQDLVRRTFAELLENAGVEIDPKAPKPNGWSARRVAAQENSAKNNANDAAEAAE